MSHQGYESMMAVLSHGSDVIVIFGESIKQAVKDLADAKILKADPIFGSTDATLSEEQIKRMMMICVPYLNVGDFLEEFKLQNVRLDASNSIVKLSERKNRETKRINRDSSLQSAQKKEQIEELHSNIELQLSEQQYKRHKAEERINQLRERRTRLFQKLLIYYQQLIQEETLHSFED